MAIFEKAYIRSSFSLASIGKTFSLSHLSSGRSSAKERKKVIAECVWASLKPVSYTHLDVYKRQITGYTAKVNPA